jgi:hypothetical protein
VAADLAARRRDLDIPRPYYALRFTPEQAGLYTVETEVEGQTLSGPFQVAEEDEPGVVQIGQPLTPVETPTVENPLGVDPLCTREPPCALHDESLDAVMAEGRPTAFLISTPAFCQTGICGPVLDLLIEARADYPDLSFVHTEVYQQPEPGNPTAGGVVGAVEDYGLTFEPSLFLIDGDARLVDRLDNIYDATELRESLDRINP